MSPALSARPTASMSACQSRARRAAARSSANRYSHLSRVTVSELIILGSPFEFAICLDRLYLAACCCVPALPGFIELPTSAERSRLDSRDQARRLPADGAP